MIHMRDIPKVRMLAPDQPHMCYLSAMTTPIGSVRFFLR